MNRVLSLLFVFVSPVLFSQDIDLQFIDSDSTNCTANSFCVDLQLKGNNGADYLGISSILFDYDPAVISFDGDGLNGINQGAYYSKNFDNVGSSPACNMFGPAYSEHSFDGNTSGKFLITILLLSPTMNTASGEMVFACPNISSNWVTVSTICFDIIDPNGNPNLTFVGNQNGTPSPVNESNFNSDTNNPADKYENGTFTPYTGLIADACVACTEFIVLSPGWNLISTNCMPDDLDMEAVFADVAANVIEVKDLTESYAPSINYNEIGDWEMTSSYRVKMLQQDTLEIVGTVVDALNTPLSLAAGWNLLPYFLDVNADPVTLFAPIAGSILEVQDLNGIYNPNTGVNTLIPMMPTEGFYIKMSAPATFTIDPANAGTP